MRFRLLEHVADGEVRRITAAARSRRFKRDEVLFHEGDPADTLLLVAKGLIAIRTTTPLGDGATLAVLGPGDWMGELALLQPSAHRTATAVALEPTEVLMLGRDQFAELRRAHPSATEALLQFLSERIRDLSSQLLEALYVPVDIRIIRRLLSVSRHYEIVDGPIVVPLTQEDLAGLAGTTRPTVNRTLRVEEQRGTLRLERGRVIILDRDSLVKRFQVQP